VPPVAPGVVQSKAGYFSFPANDALQATCGRMGHPPQVLAEHSSQAKQ
jgi:hypothetical protein